MALYITLLMYIVVLVDFLKFYRFVIVLFFVLKTHDVLNMIRFSNFRKDHE